MGLKITPSPNSNHVVVKEVKKGKEGERAGVHNNSQIVKIAGQNVEDLAYEEVLEMLHKLPPPFQIHFKVWCVLRVLNNCGIAIFRSFFFLRFCDFA